MLYAFKACCALLCNAYEVSCRAGSKEVFCIKFMLRPVFRL